MMSRRTGMNRVFPTRHHWAPPATTMPCLIPCQYHEQRLMHSWVATFLSQVLCLQPVRSDPADKGFTQIYHRDFTIAFWKKIL